MKDTSVPEDLKLSEIRKHLDEYMTNLKIDKNNFRWKANVEYLYQKLDSENDLI